MQLLCSELAFNLTVLPQHVKAPSIFSSVCARNQTCYIVLNESLEIDQSSQAAHTAEVWGVAKLHNSLPWDYDVFLHTLICHNIKNTAG